MSWLLCPLDYEPSHEEFVDAWVRSDSLAQVCAKLVRYEGITPKVCQNWFESLRSLGVQLEPFPRQLIHIKEANDLFLETVSS